MWASRLSRSVNDGIRLASAARRVSLAMLAI
jgi:hypothetical protein